MAPNFNDENSVFNFVVNEGNGVKGVADSGFTEVPGRFIQPPHLRDKQQATASPENLIIDLSELDGPNHDQVVKAIAHAAETYGYFQVVNHGVPLEVLESLKSAAYQFFGLPAEKKAAYLKGRSRSPTVMYGTSVVPEIEKDWQWRDFLNMTYTNDADALEFWPNECKKVALEYLKTNNELVKRLLEALMTNLGVKLDDARRDTLIGSRTVHINFYPPCPNPELTVGSRRHFDIGLLTVLLQDDINGGLYVKRGECLSPGDEEWIEVPPIHGALVINVGDMLQVLSNGRYKSPEHIARTRSTISRVSVPIFNAPLPLAKVGPLPELLAREVARYREFIYKEYWDNYFAKAYEPTRALNFASI